MNNLRLYSFIGNLKISVIFTLLIATHLTAQPGMEEDPKEGETIETSINFKNSSQEPGLEYTFNSQDWYYIAFTKPTSGNGELFVNGESVGNINWDNVAYDHFILNIGASYFLSYGSYFSGSIDELRVSNTVKSQSDIKSHFEANQSFSKEASTAAIWRFDEGSGTQFSSIDGDKNGNLYGDPVWVDGKFGDAIKYDGVDDRGRVTVDLIEYEVTYEFWVKFDGDIRETSQTIIQPYGSLTSIDLEIQQTLLESEPDDRDIIVIRLPEVVAQQEDELLMPVIVEKFVDIFSIQYILTWDPSVIEYKDVQDFGIPGLDAGSFHLFEPGRLTFSWTPDDLQPVSLDDGATLFNISFKAVGVAGSSTAVEFGDDPTQKEITDADGQILTATYQNGNISVLDQVILGGYIKTQKREPVAGVEVELIGSAELKTTTDESGWYEFSVVPGLEYHIAPLFDTEDDDGVTTLDIVIMHWHILGKKYMMSNLDLIAADVNGTGSLTSLDLVETRSVVLHSPGEKFRGKNSIEFINDDYTGDPDVFEYKNYLDIIPTVSHTNLNFTAVKRGDANRNWNPNKNKGGRINELEEWHINLEENAIDGVHSTIALKAQEFNDLIAMQFTMEWDPTVYQFEGLADGLLHFEANTSSASEGKLTVSWNTKSLEGVSLKTDDFLSALEFERMSEGDAKMQISSGITNALAFNSALESFSVASHTMDFGLLSLKLYPNPATDQIKIIGTKTLRGSRYSIINTVGKLVRGGILSGDSVVDVVDLETGMYMIRIEIDPGRVKNLKFIKR